MTGHGRQVSVLGVPTSAGSHNPGQDKAPAGQARQARAYLERRVDDYLLHFDVDVLHTGLFPLANFPHFAGLTLDEVSAALNEFARGEKFGGLVVTEVNPDHDPGGQLLAALVRTVAGALAA